MVLPGLTSAQPAPALLANCATCHGVDGNATVAAFPSLAAQPKVFLETQLVLIREGLRDIPGMADVMKGMSDDTISALATHYAAQPARVQPGPLRPELFRAGQAVARQALCGTCHLPDFAGQQQVPRLAGQNEAYLLQTMKQLRDSPGPGRDTIMAATLHGMQDGDLEALAHHLAQSPVPRAAAAGRP
ncbi:MAG: c-type cytochrome [Chitinophagaceae bacterium]|nr:c-type cytochrome [Rubrivivax sp.]